MKPSNRIVNHIAFLIDVSYSMFNLIDHVKKVFESQVGELEKSADTLNQETLVSFYTFSSKVKSIAKDVPIKKLGNFAKHFIVESDTALRDSMYTAINDFKEIKSGDNDSFLIYVLTDGEENASAISTSMLKNSIEELDDNFSVVAFVPNERGRKFMLVLGVPDGNIKIWETSEKGLETVAQETSSGMGTYYATRAAGGVGTKGFFSTNLDPKQVRDNLQILRGKFQIFKVTKDCTIRDFVEAKIGKWETGITYYELTKREEIQANKLICVQKKGQVTVYHGPEARTLLNLGHNTVKVTPDASQWTIFVQSNSNNRRLVAGTSALIMGV